MGAGGRNEVPFGLYTATWRGWGDCSPCLILIERQGNGCEWKNKKKLKLWATVRKLLLPKKFAYFLIILWFFSKFMVWLIVATWCCCCVAAFYKSADNLTRCFLWLQPEHFFFIKNVSANSAKFKLTRLWKIVYEKKPVEKDTKWPKRTRVANFSVYPISTMHCEKKQWALQMQTLAVPLQQKM